MTAAGFALRRQEPGASDEFDDVHAVRRDRALGHVFGYSLVPEHAVEFAFGPPGVLFRMVDGDDCPGELGLDCARVLTRGESLPDPVQFRRGQIRAEGEVVENQLVRDRHRLAEHLVRRIGDADVVAVRLRHLELAVGADQQGHGYHYLWFLAELALEFAADQQVPVLVRTAEFDVGFDRDRVVALEQRVEQFVHVDRHPVLEPLAEVVTFEDSRHGVAGGDVDDVRTSQRLGPFRVAPELTSVRIKDAKHLLAVPLHVFPNLFVGELGPGLGPAGRVPDFRREVADNQYRQVARVLELAELAKRDRES
jgi:hypothetical protein